MTRNAESFYISDHIKSMKSFILTLETRMLYESRYKKLIIIPNCKVPNTSNRALYIDIYILERDLKVSRSPTSNRNI